MTPEQLRIAALIANALASDPTTVRRVVLQASAPVQIPVRR